MRKGRGRGRVKGEERGVKDKNLDVALQHCSSIHPRINQINDAVVLRHVISKHTTSKCIFPIKVQSSCFVVDKETVSGCES